MGVNVNPQIVILFDVNGTAHAVIDGVAIPVNTPSLLLAGHDDGAIARVMRTAVDGTVRIDPTGTTIQPITHPAFDAPLSSLATEFTLASLFAAFLAEDFASETTLASLFAAFTAEDFATEATLAALYAAFVANNSTLGQKTMALSAPVVIASDQMPIAVTNTPPGSRVGVSSCTRSLGGGTSGTLQAMRATVYTEPAVGGQRSVVSTVASDASAGVGMRSVRITYYDDTGAGPFTEVVVLNGVTAVNTVAVNIQFIEKIEGVTVGTTGTNVGTINLMTLINGGGTVIGSIGIGNLLSATGDGQTLWAHHYVATGSIVRLSMLTVAIQAGGSGVSGRFFIRKNMPLVANSIDSAIDSGLLVIGTFRAALEFYVEVVGFARLTCFVIPGSNNAVLGASFDWAEFP